MNRSTPEEDLTLLIKRRSGVLVYLGFGDLHITDGKIYDGDGALSKRDVRSYLREIANRIQRMR